jgi:cation transport regulator ChaC
MVLWVFGYGSLIWHPNFSYEERVVGYVKNYRRAFHQACIDFRGTQKAPGRTLTLEEQDGAVTWGVAYRVTASVEAKMVEAYLNQRERTYDVRALMDVYVGKCSQTPAIVGAVTYIATPCSSNSWYLGPAPLLVIAEQIATSRGPGGENHEYLFRLEESLRQMGATCVDKEITDLSNVVREILCYNNQVPKIITGRALQSRHDSLTVGSRDNNSRRQRDRHVNDEDAVRRVWINIGAMQVTAS